MLNREIVSAQQKTIDGGIKCVLKCFCWLFCKAQNGLFLFVFVWQDLNVLPFLFYVYQYT